MQEFTKIERIVPQLKPTNERVDNFREISHQYTKEEARSQASRCVQCGNPYCSASGCPLSNNIPQWLKFIAQKDLELAFRISNETSPFPEILGRICPQDRLCEGACTLNDGNDEHTIGAITIGSIEVAISERGFEAGLKPEFASQKTGHKVAIIGSGPAGLSCATFLLRAGITPVVYEKADAAGGLLTYGIPGFKLEKKAVERRVNSLLEAGMELHLSTEIGKDVTFQEIYDKHDAVFMGIGATQGKVLSDENYNTDNLYMAVPFLTNTQKKLDEKMYDKKYDVKGKNVIVIGGGDTAMDCVRTSIRENAASVRCFYRRDEINMPGSRKEVAAAKEEGVEFRFLEQPKRFQVDEAGNITAVEFVNMQLSEADASGRQRASEVAGSEHFEEADIVILALGFDNERSKYLNANGIDTNEWGAIVTNDKLETSKKGVYAGGDTVRGADLVVTAALDGREAAFNIMEVLLEETEEDVVKATV
ncbi:glutamate synthase subunit beta [Sediminitomix flava]|uniref:Glutamate synthase (NADPH) small subunit n=1 Tax=Sediminitomix flava TaxID=379075 RepID=A0A315YWA7_SEDFL|nr:glutamate synthase subunit beta [Sediminitomix flava]PWJ34129.1 glutamate synthase (NADPH) small subunit [Sediminitomix flava]